MTFNAALTGLRAANTELEVSGNNIANASTVGFKQSRVQFADVFSSATIGGGSNDSGNGVRVSNIAQQFSQGSIGFTDSALDLAINGGGFFILSDSGSQAYTRSGQFSVDAEGQIVSPDGGLLQGFPASESGVVSGVLDNLQIDSANITPRQTSEVDLGVNLNADDTVLATRGEGFDSTGTLIGQVSVNTGTNGYTPDTFNIDGQPITVPSSGAAGVSADVIAADLSGIQGVSASAVTTASFSINGGATAIAPGELNINGVPISGNNLTEIAQSINAISTEVTAAVNGTSIDIEHARGADISFNLDGAALTSLDVAGSSGGAATIAAGDNAAVGGVITTNVEEDFTLDLSTASGAIINPGIVPTPFQDNTFDPNVESSYNSVTSATIFDSLGAPHVLTSFFVKESQVNNSPNTWSVYVQVDGENVGDPDPLSLTPTEPTLAQYRVTFNSDGSYNAALSDDIVVSNWTPLDPSGTANGALGPSNGAALPVPVPAISSNFSIDLADATQFQGVFSVNSLDQTGFSTGQLSGLDIDETGIIFARYSNGEALILGQVALADFANEQGLTPIGDSAWAESFQSGAAVVGAPLSATLGSIQSGALEDSNVEIAEELVALIIAQRNFQANARTIETANEVTQTIINLR